MGVFGACGSPKSGQPDAGGAGGAGGVGTGGGPAGCGGAGGEAGGGGGCGGSSGSGPGAAIIVTSPSGQLATRSADGYCDLLEAIEAANTDQPVGDCAAGKGADRIILAAGGRYPTPGTLRISAPVTIGVADEADGSATILAAPVFATDAADPWSRCLVHASTVEGVVKLADVTLSQDLAVSLSGACVTHGFFELRRGHVTGFGQGGIAAYCLPEFGCDHEQNAEDGTTVRVLASLIDENRSARNGGGIFSEGSGTTLYVSHSAVVNNVALLRGGGLYFGGGWSSHLIDHSTVSGNTAAAGGGVAVSFASCTATYLYVSNSTIASNTAMTSGGGIHFDGNTDCYAQDVTVLSSIINNNTALTSSESNINADWDHGMFGCDRGSLIYVAPGLPTPRQQMGQTPCRFDVPDAGMGPLMSLGGRQALPLHPLLRGSPAIDAAEDDQTEEQQRDSYIGLYDPPAPPPWTLFERVVDGDGDGVAVRDLGATEAHDRWQTELLTVAAKGPAPHGLIMTPVGYSRGAGTTYAATNATGQFVTYQLPIAETGSYAIAVGVRQTSDAGQFQAAVADDPNGPWTNLGATHDTYAATSAFTTLSLAANHGFPSPGQKLIRFTVTGKNVASASYGLFLDFVEARKTP